jgi:ABC-type Fe3+/spermidine/putrescine transport system ATPase subunit
MSRSITVKAVEKSYHGGTGAVKVIDGIDLHVGQGEILVLLGASGCGKTTLLRCLAGLEIPDAGEISIGQQVVFSADRKVFVQPNARGLGMVFQSYAIWPNMTVRDNVAFPLKRQHAARSTIGDLVDRALSSVGCLELADRYGRELSGGQQQRVAVARAIVAQPSVLLLDEPLSNLDATLRARLRLELSSLVRGLNLTMVYVTHDQAEALTLADRIAVMDAGRVAQIGTPHDLYERPNSPRVAAALGGLNRLAGRVVAIEGAVATVDTEWGTVNAGGGDRSYCAPGLVPATAVEVCFRPHQASFVRNATPGKNVLVGRVRQVGYAGDITTYVVRSGATDVEVVSSGDDSAAPVGDEVSLTVPSELCHVYRRDMAAHPAGAAADPGA